MLSVGLLTLVQDPTNQCPYKPQLKPLVSFEDEQMLLRVNWRENVIPVTLYTTCIFSLTFMRMFTTINT